MLHTNAHRLGVFSLALALTACATDAGPESDRFERPTRPGLIAVGAPPLARGVVPGIENGPLFLSGGGFEFIEPTTPGSAAFDAAVVVDLESETPPPSLGAGAYDVTVGGVNYTSTDVDSMAGVFQEADTGDGYLVLSVFRTDPGPGGIEVGTVVHVIAPATDFAPGGTVALDGADRVALFMTGNIEAAEPEIVGAAVSGTIEFTSGGLNPGAEITATVAGDFGEVDWTPADANGQIDPGAYVLTHLPPAEAMCDGTLTGAEAEFTGITLADLGFVDGAVNVALPTSDTVEISGTPINSGFGVTGLNLTSNDVPPGLVYGEVAASGAGPSDTTKAAIYMVLDTYEATPASVLGYAGAGFLTDDGQGACSVAFAIELTAP